MMIFHGDSDLDFLLWWKIGCDEIRNFFVKKWAPPSPDSPVFFGGIETITGWCLGQTPLKNMSSSIGMISNPIYGKMKLMFQTINQINIAGLLLLYWHYRYQCTVDSDVISIPDIIVAATVGRFKNFMM